MRLTLIILLAMFALVACSQSAPSVTAKAPAKNTSGKKYDAETAFQPSNAVMTEIDDLLVRAEASDKLALIVMGANWCHDSRGFVKTLNNKRLQEVLDDRYEVLLVDVGYLQRGRKVIERFGIPIIYGTPTVLVVDPRSELLINRDDMHRWRDAARIDVNEAIEYFTRMAKPAALLEAQKAVTADSPVLIALYAEINAFEMTQAERIYQGFARLAPMLAMDRAERPEAFNEEWDQVRDLRYQITDDLAALRSEAKRRVASGETDIALTYPDYPPFSWE